MINDSRINVAGIPEDRVDELADYLLAGDPLNLLRPCGATQSAYIGVTAQANPWRGTRHAVSSSIPPKSRTSRSSTPWGCSTG